MCRSTTQRKMHTNVFIGSAYFEFSFLFTFIFIYCFGGTLHAKHGFMPNSLMYLSPCIIVSSPSNCSLHLHISVSFPLLVVVMKVLVPFVANSPKGNMEHKTLLEFWLSYSVGALHTCTHDVNTLLRFYCLPSFSSFLV
jgi:uncharacterized membrane protein YesL